MILGVNSPSGEMKVTVPAKVLSGKVSTRTSAFCPGLTLPISVSSTKIFRSTVARSERVRTSRPGRDHFPRFDVAAGDDSRPGRLQLRVIELDRHLIEGCAGRGDDRAGRLHILFRRFDPDEVALGLLQEGLPLGHPRFGGADRFRPASLPRQIVGLSAPLVFPEGRVVAEADGVPLLLRDDSLLEEVFVAGRIFFRVFHDGGGALHRLFRPGDLLCPAAGLEIVQLGFQGADARLGPGHFGGEGLFVDFQKGFRLFPVFHGFFEIGLRLFETGAELRRVQLGQDLVLRDGLSLAYVHPEHTAAGLEGKMGLRGLDGSGVVELAPPDLALSIVDQEPHTDKEDQKNDDDAFFQGSTSSEIE